MSYSVLHLMRAQLILVCLAFGVARAPAQSSAEEKLRERVDKLEKRIHQLEQKIEKLEAGSKTAPARDVEAKLIGSWVIEKRPERGITAIRFDKDGSCAHMEINGGGEQGYRSKYFVIGKKVSCKIPKDGPGDILGPQEFLLEVLSITDKELEIEVSKRAFGKGYEILKFRLKRE